MQHGTCGKFSRETPKIGHQDINELALAAFQGGKMAESEIFMLRTKLFGFLSGLLTLLITLAHEIGIWDTGFHHGSSIFIHVYNYKHVDLQV